LDFTNQYFELSAAFFSSIKWSHETSVSVFSRKKQYQIHVKSSISKKNKPLAPAVRSEEFSVMFWGAFTSEGRIAQVVVPDKNHAIVYKKVLIQNIAPYIKQPKNKIFMQENAPVQKSASVIRYLRNYKIPTLDWHPHIPDLNPIKNIWGLLHLKVSRMPNLKK
jgi:DDE superfamily endonuclease